MTVEKYKENYLNKCQNYPVRLYKPKEMAELLRCSLNYVYKLCSLGILKPMKTRCNPGKNNKYTRSFFTDLDIKRAIDFRFNLKAQERKIAERIRRGKRLRF